MAWPDGGSNEVKKTIGATGRQHATIAAWEADTDENCTAGWGAGDYASPCSPVGECYDDADLAGSSILGATTDATHYRRLTVAEGHRHDGTAFGGGVTLTSGLNLRELYGVAEWLLNDTATLAFQFYHVPDNSFNVFRNCVASGTGGTIYYSDNAGSGAIARVENCISVATAAVAFRAVTCRNCTGIAADYTFKSCTCVNCISIRTGTSSAYFWCTGSNNISSDATDAGADTINNIAASDLFVNAGAGTEDLHLKSDATAASGVGADLSAYFTIDIDGDTRSDWDIGADEYSGGGPPSFKSAWATGINSLVQ